VKIVNWAYPEESFMSPAIRHAVLAAVAAAATFAFTPAAHAAPLASQYTCDGGSVVAEIATGPIAAKTKPAP
jgi:hypothetical protein